MLIATGGAQFETYLTPETRHSLFFLGTAWQRAIESSGSLASLAKWRVGPFRADEVEMGSTRSERISGHEVASPFAHV